MGAGASAAKSTTMVKSYLEFAAPNGTASRGDNDQLSPQARHVTCLVARRFESKSDSSQEVASDMTDSPRSSSLKDLEQAREPVYKTKRAGIAVVATFYMVLVAALGVIFAYSVEAVLRDRQLYNVRSKLEALDKDNIKAAYGSFQQSTWIYVYDCSNGTFPLTARTSNFTQNRIRFLNKVDEYEDSFQRFKKRFRSLRRTYREQLRSAVKPYKTYIKAVEFELSQLLSREGESLYDTEAGNVARDESGAVRSVPAYNRAYRKLRKKLRHVQARLWKTRLIWVVSGACTVFFVSMLFVLLRFWALDGILIAEVTSRARNTLTHELGVPAFIVDARSRILDLNQAAIDSFNVTKSEIVGETISAVLIFEQLQHEDSDDVIDAHSVPRKAYHVHPGSGKKSQFVAHIIRLREIDGSERYTIVCRDLTVSYELEIQKKVLSRKSIHEHYKASRVCRRVLPRSSEQVHSGSAHA